MEAPMSMAAAVGRLLIPPAAVPQVRLASVSQLASASRMGYSPGPSCVGAVAAAVLAGAAMARPYKRAGFRRRRQLRILRGRIRIAGVLEDYYGKLKKGQEPMRELPNKVDPRRASPPFDPKAREEAIAKRSGSAKDFNRRVLGTVVGWQKSSKTGFVRYGRTKTVAQKERGDFLYKFYNRDLPENYLKEHGGEVALGQVVEFDESKGPDGTLLARHLVFQEAKTFGELNLKREVIAGAAAALGRDPRIDPHAGAMIVPAPVQASAIPQILDGQQLMIASETGSGKSLAYMLPLVQMVRERTKERNFDYGLETLPGSPTAIVFAATRELALQTARVLKLVCEYAKLRVKCVTGGDRQSWNSSRNQMAGMVDILVCTPDRALRLREQNMLQLRDVAFVVIDEADWLLTQGFGDVYQMLENIEQNSDHGKKLHYTLVTASITKPLWYLLANMPRFRNIRALESKALHQPQANCSHSMLYTKGRDKLEMLIGLLQPELMNRKPSRQTIVFCNTVSSCKSVTYKMREAFAEDQAHRFIGSLHKDQRAEDRSAVLDAFARGEYKVMIATDIAQRGLDLPCCGHIINFDFPLNPIDYLHRAGRTARFGEPGRVSSFVKKGNHWMAKAIQASCKLGKPIDNLSGDKRDYFRGGALGDVMEKYNQKVIPRERQLYSGSLR